MTKKTEKMARIVGTCAAVGMVGAAAAAVTMGAKNHSPRQKLMKDARQMGKEMTHMWGDMVSMFHA